MYEDATGSSFGNTNHEAHEVASGADSRADLRADRREERNGPPQGEDFSLELEEERGLPVVVAAGELDLYAMPRMRALMAEAMARAGAPRSGPRGGPSPGSPSVIVDLSEVSFADSMTIGVLIGENTKLQELGGELHLVFEEGAMARLLGHAGLDEAFKVHTDRRSAVRNIEGQG
ncbi:MAG: STAS domain-containing protein [Rubrobacter sp.]|nr:STAS domain-containing protein [Rubrobacter sp.]